MLLTYKLIYYVSKYGIYHSLTKFSFTPFLVGGLPPSGFEILIASNVAVPMLWTAISGTQSMSYEDQNLAEASQALRCCISYFLYILIKPIVLIASVFLQKIGTLLMCF